MVATTSTALAVSEETTTVVSTSVFDKFQPMEFIEKMGKAFSRCGAGGCKNENDGMVMALACLTQKKDIFEIARQYHLIDGKLVTRADEMLARFKRAGGDVKWLKNGTDGLEAELQLSKDGVTVSCVFTIEKAAKAGYIKDGSQWKKRPDQMLRARCITDLIGMQWPEIKNGDYTEEEMVDVIETTATVVKSSGGRSKADVEKRAAELRETAGGEVVTTTTALPSNATSAPETIVDAEVVEQIEKPPFDTDVKSESPAETGDADDVIATSISANFFEATVLEIESLISQCYMTNDKVMTTYNKQFSTEHNDFNQFTEEQQTTILGKLRGIKDKIDRGELVVKDGVLMKA